MKRGHVFGDPGRVASSTRSSCANLIGDHDGGRRREYKAIDLRDRRHRLFEQIERALNIDRYKIGSVMRDDLRFMECAGVYDCRYCELVHRAADKIAIDD